MSVVNKMLQDIDRRRAAAGPGTERPVTPARVPRKRRKHSRSLLLWLSAAAVLVTVLVLYKRESGEAVAQSSIPPVVAVAASVPVPAPAATLPASPPAQTAAPIISPVALPATIAPVSAPEAPITVQEKPAGEPGIPLKKSEAVHRATARAEALKMSTRLSALTIAPPSAEAPASAPRAVVAAAAPVAASTSPSSKPVAVDTSPPSIAIRQIAGEETVRAARTLWNDGAHAAAIETLRPALAAAERQRDPGAMQVLGRELARMQVAENNPQAALDLLKRLENRFIDDAEAWALRGNAFQRLGQHAEAADAYLGALRLKGGESRWMLGAAISLAALGKLDEARSWADRAAERGPIPPSIAGYLKQLGVALP